MKYLKKKMYINDRSYNIKLSKTINNGNNLN